ncbi:hypothetical protein [Streptomyces sp. uw30]|uniref:hypothetical protein n=1 Tax=Streptomyces sp. uw30 TaxID=1828179 RepID=UPI0021C8D259|nr:hypothetical protein [Streptomyces sp. uw30]
MVVLALTGFSSGCGQGSRSDSSGSGGGCSSSSQDHDSSSTSGSCGPHGSSSSGSSGRDAHDSGTTSGGSGAGTHRSQPTHSPTPTASPSSETARPLKDGTAVLISCASPDDPYATVEIRNPNGRDAVFTVKINFKDKHGFTMIDTGNQVSVPAKDTTTYRVAMASTGRLDEIDQCEVNPRATADR